MLRAQGLRRSRADVTHPPVHTGHACLQVFQGGGGDDAEAHLRLDALHTDRRAVFGSKKVDAVALLPVYVARGQKELLHVGF